MRCLHRQLLSRPGAPVGQRAPAAARPHGAARCALHPPAHASPLSAVTRAACPCPPAVLDTLLHGVVPPPGPPMALERPELMQRVRDMLRPTVRGQAAAGACAVRTDARSAANACLLSAPLGCNHPYTAMSQEPSKFYKIVTGPPGGGKSTLLRAACRELGGGVGCAGRGSLFVCWHCCAATSRPALPVALHGLTVPCFSMQLRGCEPRL